MARLNILCAFFESGLSAASASLAFVTSSYASLYQASASWRADFLLSLASGVELDGLEGGVSGLVPNEADAGVARSANSSSGSNERAVMGSPRVGQVGMALFSS